MDEGGLSKFVINSTVSGGLKLEQWKGASNFPLFKKISNLKNSLPLKWNNHKSDQILYHGKNPNEKANPNKGNVNLCSQT